MKLLIFGARGRTGRELVAQATEKGHEVTAFEGDVRDYEAVRKAVVGHDAVVSAMGTKARVGLVIALIIASQFLAANISAPGWLIRIILPVVLLLFFSRRDPALSLGAKNIVRAMKESGVRRLIWQSSLGVGSSRGQLGVLYTLLMIPFFLRGMFADKELQESVIKESGLHWTIVRPGGLTNGKKKGTYRHPTTTGLRFSTPSVSRADVADYILNLLDDQTSYGTTPAIVD